MSFSVSSFNQLRRVRESDLEYFGARYYSSELNLFVEADSLIPDVYDPQSLNRYSYVLNNPYKYVEKGSIALASIGVADVVGGTVSIIINLEN